MPSLVPQTPQNAIQEAMNASPLFAEHGIIGITTPQPSNPNMMESWPAGETGTPTEPRPTPLPLNTGVIQVFHPNAGAQNVLADLTSHFLIHSDPKVQQYYDQFVSSITPQQRQRFKQDYAYAQQNEGERRPYHQWLNASRLPAYFRGYTFQQWPQSFNKKVFTPDQIKLFNQVRAYVGLPEGQ